MLRDRSVLPSCQDRADQEYPRCTHATKQITRDRNQQCSEIVTVIGRLGLKLDVLASFVVAWMNRNQTVLWDDRNLADKAGIRGLAKEW
jgi:hypothetical protein